jgi:phosphopantothenoylcysteine decarboxylase/phosphopantothenate--cysteine ligase
MADKKEQPKRIVLGVTGGIAAYKACELTRLLVKSEFSVHVIMTKNAREFVSPLTFSTLSGNPVAYEMFSGGAPESIEHIDLAGEADLVVVAPATANIIGKVANGIADDMLSTVIMATLAPVVFCPSMNVNMYDNPVTLSNIKKLNDLGYRFVEPGEGFLACGWEGKGRLADPSDILAAVNDIFDKKDLAGLKIMVTAGPTREPIDPVRFISNHSSGKMGYAIAERARARGAQVVLVSGPSPLTPPWGVDLVKVESAADMAAAVKDRFGDVDVVIKAAAVADITPADVSSQKLKKDECGDVIRLARTEDILKGLGETKGDKLLVGFAAETTDLVKNAKAKLKNKNLDIIVANDLTRSDSGFNADTNAVRIFDSNGTDEILPVMRKEKVADEILTRIQKKTGLWKKKEK